MDILVGLIASCASWGGGVDETFLSVFLIGFSLGAFVFVFVFDSSSIFS